jgi:uncharacterized membrane protein
MDQKTISWVSYITLIGWIIALVSFNSSPDKSSLARFHLRQSLGIFAAGFVLYIVAVIMAFAVPMLFFLLPVVWILMLVCWIIGLIAAVNGEEKPIPLVGPFFQQTFTFIG